MAQAQRGLSEARKGLKQNSMNEDKGRISGPFFVLVYCPKCSESTVLKEIRGGGGIKQNGRQRRQIRREKRAVNGAESKQAREKGKRKDLGAAGMMAKGKSRQRADRAVMVQTESIRAR